MARLRTPSRGGGGVRSDLVAYWRHAGRVTPQTVRADRLERGEVVVVQGWQLGPFRPSWVALYDTVRIESDGSLTAVRPVIEIVNGVRHAVDYLPVVAGGDRSDIVIELAEVVGRVDDPANWTTGNNDPQPPPNAA